MCSVFKEKFWKRPDTIVKIGGIHKTAGEEK